MTENEVSALRLAIEIFDKKCLQLARHRHPNIYLENNDELFSNWFEDGLDSYNVDPTGKNAHPDLIINGVGFELKSFKNNPQIQFNSTIPCGGFKHKKISGECYYALARYTEDRNYGYLEEFTICDGDFFNHDREKAFSHSNKQETGFGDYGDGICRYRKMYSFPSPFRIVKGISLISKFSNAVEFNHNIILDTSVQRVNTKGEEFVFYVYRHKSVT